MSSFQSKVAISASSAILFALLNLSEVYKLTNDYLPVSTTSANGCPTASGKVIHALAFFCLSYLSMGNIFKDVAKKVKYSLYATLIFFALSSSALFEITRKVYSADLADANGCPTLLGVIVHSVVYFLALIAVMYLPEC